MGERGKADSVMKVGDRVEVEADPGEWSPGTVVKLYEASNNGTPTPYVVVKYDEGALYEYSSLAASLVRPLSQGYAVGDEVEAISYAKSEPMWVTARIVREPEYLGDSHRVSIDGLVCFRGDDELRRPQRTEPVVTVPMGDGRTATVETVGDETFVTAIAPTRCPRCSGPRDNLARAHLHLCGCLVKWDAPEPVYVGQGCHYEANGRSNGETVWIAEGQGVAAAHPLRDTAIALWRERVRAKP